MVHTAFKAVCLVPESRVKVESVALWGDRLLVSATSHSYLWQLLNQCTLCSFSAMRRTQKQIMYKSGQGPVVLANRVSDQFVQVLLFCVHALFLTSGLVAELYIGHHLVLTGVSSVAE
jgi:hypothetical protein